MSISGYLETLLNRNVSSLVIAYITDPPFLPFLKELRGDTRDIENSLNRFWFYNNTYIQLGHNYKSVGKYKIRKHYQARFWVRWYWTITA